jgi:hypothetical protein
MRLLVVSSSSASVRGCDTLDRRDGERQRDRELPIRGPVPSLRQFQLAAEHLDQPARQRQTNPESAARPADARVPG